MKKLIFIALFALTTTIASAQVSFGVQAGANFGMGKFKYDEAAFSGTPHTQSNKVQVGFLGGFIAEIPFSSSLAFRPEINFLQQGTKFSYTLTSGIFSYAGQSKVTLNYIQVPLNVIYKIPVGAGKVFFGLGPSVEIGMSGKNKFTSTTDPTDNENRTIKFDGKKSEGVTDPTYYDKDHLKRVDVSVNVLAGYQLAMGVFIKLAYMHGFIEASPDKSDPDPGDRYSYKNSGFNVSVGYMIGGGSSSKKKK